MNKLELKMCTVYFSYILGTNIKFTDGDSRARILRSDLSYIQQCFIYKLLYSYTRQVSHVILWKADYIGS